MPAVLTYPGVYIEEVSSGVRSIAGVGTSTALFVGWAPRGPIDAASRISTYTDFERLYGGLDARSLLGYAVRHFFDNGGSDAWIIRLAATDATAGSNKIDALDVSANSPGDWAKAYKVQITPRSDDASRFRLSVLLAGTPDVVVEKFENLSMKKADARFVESVINGRSTVVTVKANTEVAPTTTTAVALGAAATPGKPGTILTAADAAFQTALLALFGDGAIASRIDLFNIVCVPGLTPATAASQATIGSLETKVRARRAFLVVDSAENETVATMQGSATGTTGTTGADGINAAIYFPWVLAPDPLAENAIRAFPPGGFIAGLYARTDAQRGVWKAPAGSEASITGAAGLAIKMSDAENGQLNPLGINCLRTLPVYGTVAWGARTLNGQNDRASEWKYVPVRRLALYLEESLFRGTQWVVFEPNDEPLWAQIRLSIGSFLNTLFRQGAFQGASPRDAYFVKCDRETTTQADIDNGVVNIRVGFAPLKPAEFVVLQIQQIAQAQ